MSRNDTIEKSTTLTAVITNIITTAITHTVVITTITQNLDYCTIHCFTTHCPIIDASSDVGSNIGSNNALALAATTAFVFILTAARITRISIWCHCHHYHNARNIASDHYDVVFNKPTIATVTTTGVIIIVDVIIVYFLFYIVSTPFCIIAVVINI